MEGCHSHLMTAFTALILATGGKPALKKAWLCCIYMSQVDAFDVTLLNRCRIGTSGSCARWVKECIHVFLFLTIKNQMTNENAGHYLNIRDGGQNPVQYNTKRDNKADGAEQVKACVPSRKQINPERGIR